MGFYFIIFLSKNPFITSFTNEGFSNGAKCPAFGAMQIHCFNFIGINFITSGGVVYRNCQ
jgi:hypothetical protein